LAAQRSGEGIQKTLSSGHTLPQTTGLKAVVLTREAFGSRHLSQQIGQLMQPTDRLIRGARSLLHGVRMALRQGIRPVQSSTSTKVWPAGSHELARQLHQALSINNHQWHALKGQPQRRAAEQLSAALVQLLEEGNNPAAVETTPQRLQAVALVEHALGWLKGELRDPGCPSHGR
jgi:hypothetical protein